MKIPTLVPCLWLTQNARQAAEFYCTHFPESSIRYAARIPVPAAAAMDVAAFTLAGQPFVAMSAGPFQANPSLSFFVHFDPSRDEHAREHLDALWEVLCDGGQVLMPLGEQSFSQRYGWVQDRYGVSWQLILSNPRGEPRPVIVPCLFFTGAVRGKAEEAGEFYRSVFPGSCPGQLFHYPAGSANQSEGMVMYSDFRLGETWVVAMDGGPDRHFSFNEAISLMIECETQEEIDFYWERLSAVPEAEACGWCKDRYGISWQIVPRLIHDVFASGDLERITRHMEAVLTMKKLDLAALQRAVGQA